MTTVLDPRYWVEQESGLVVPEAAGLAAPQPSTIYPGNDAWLQLEQRSPYPANSIVNPGFEADTSGWTTTGGATISRTTAEKHSGAASLQVVVASPTDAAGAYYQVAAAEDQWWHGGVWVKAPAGLALSLHISPGGETTARTDFVGTGAWQFVMADALMPTGSTFTRLYIKTNGAVSGTFYVDDAEIASPAWTQVETVPDSGGKANKAVTSTVTPPTLSTAQSVFGGSSLNCSGGTGRALSTPDHADFAFGAGDFTVEGRFYFTVIRKALFTQQNPTDQTDKSFEWTMDVMGAATPGFTVYLSTDGATWVQFDQAFTVVLNQWYHFALVRSGNLLMFFVDGTQIGASQNIGAITLWNSSQPVRLFGDARASGNDFQGYVDEFRVSKGIARWTSNFTVPSAPYTRDQYTALLMHFDGTDGQQVYADSSGVPPTPFDPGADPAWMEVER